MFRFLCAVQGHMLETDGVRNVQVFEDGFPVTQPDGLARTDLTDPHAYSSVDVVQVPSSQHCMETMRLVERSTFIRGAGARSRGSRLVQDSGSFNYFNDFVTYGAGNEHYQLSAFVSNVRAIRNGQ